MTRRHWWQFWRRRPAPRFYADLGTIKGKYTVLTMGGAGNDVRYQTYDPDKDAPLHPDSGEEVKG